MHEKNINCFHIDMKLDFNVMLNHCGYSVSKISQHLVEVDYAKYFSCVDNQKTQNN